MTGQDAEVLWVARYDYKEGWELKQHSHDYFQIIYIVRGDGTFFINGEEYTIKPGTLFLMKSGQKHGLLNGYKSRLMTLDIKFLLHNSEILTRMNNCKNVYFFTDAVPTTLFERIRQEGLKREAFFKDMSNLYLLQMLYLLLRYPNEACSEEKPQASLITEDPVKAGDRIIEYIHKHYIEDISLKVVSESLGYNTSYICQVFKKEHSSTLMKFLYAYRMEKVKDLMVYSDYSMKQIAEMTGFKSIHHFSRLFHKLEGMTPGQWRKRERDGIRKDIYINEIFEKTFKKVELT